MRSSRTSSSPTQAHRGDRGQAIGLVLVCVAVIALAAVAVSGVSVRIVQRSEAQGAADAVALAGASDGRGAAVEVAHHWGARLISYSETVASDGIVVTVSVRVGAETAQARASTTP